MRIIEDPYCLKCGKQLEEEAEEYCTDCRKGHHLYVRGRGLFRYEGQEKEAIHKIKYENKREYLVTIADYMAEYLGEEIRRWNIDICVPVPMHRRKRRKRGYNQAEILAGLLSEHLDLVMDKKLLIKLYETGEQKELSAKERRNNLQDAFFAEDCSGLNILLVDDVYTTGSTIDAAADALLQAGANKVYFAAICIGSGNS